MINNAELARVIFFYFAISWRIELERCSILQGALGAGANGHESLHRLFCDLWHTCHTEEYFFCNLVFVDDMKRFLVSKDNEIADWSSFQSSLIDLRIIVSGRNHFRNNHEIRFRDMPGIHCHCKIPFGKYVIQMKKILIGITFVNFTSTLAVV